MADERMCAAGATSMLFVLDAEHEILPAAQGGGYVQENSLDPEAPKSFRIR
jgi:hypothetical protein